jgi:NAD(P)-dependent dehydrogenase (short-subunit alcohol dehydrogenase family)
VPASEDGGRTRERTSCRRGCGRPGPASIEKAGGRVLSDLKDQAAIVTGAGRGVGRAIAEALAAAGAAVALVARSEPEVAETAKLIHRAGGYALPLSGDVTDRKRVAEIVEQADRELGRIDLLVNNAGTCRAIGPMYEADPKEWWRDVETSVMGTFVCTHAVIPRMISRRSGRIINISSYAATRPAPYISGYAAGKAAVLHLTNSLAAETRAFGVSVFAITPGTVRTQMTEGLLRAAEERALASNLVSGKWLPAERAGDLAVLLASGKADRLSGRFIHVLDDLTDLLRRADEIEQNDLYVLRLRT